VDNIDKVAKAFGKNKEIGEDELKNYLKNNIDYVFDSEKKKGMNLFLELLKKL
jgi:predicted solute-binding protein